MQRKLGVSEENLKYPELDRVNGSDSSQYLAEHIKLKSDNGAYIQDILDYSKTQDIYQATIAINNKHRDLEVDILPLKEEALVTIQHRPTNTIDKENVKVEISKNKQAITPIFYKLANLYGIKFHSVTIADLQSDPLFKDVLDAQHTNAFILNGDIYINTDVADIDAPIHELSHLLLGSIKFQNPTIYNEIVSLAEQFPGYSEIAKRFLGRTKSDINEEVFVTELAKFVSNRESVIQELPEFVQEEILYNIKRMLDSMLMGDISVKAIPNEHLLNMSLFNMAELVNSNVFENISKGTLNDSQMHRILNNRKSDLLKKNELIEQCE